MLNATYRTPSALQKLADMYVLEGAASKADLAELSEALEVVEIPSTTHDERAAELVRNLVGHGVPPSSIAVLSLKSFEGQTAPRLPGNIGAPQCLADEAHAGKSVVVDSVRRFKGLERPFIILRDLDPELDHYGIRMRIAMTRCLVKMWVVASKEAMAKDRVLFMAKTVSENPTLILSSAVEPERAGSSRGTVGRSSLAPWKSEPPRARVEVVTSGDGDERPSGVRTSARASDHPPSGAPPAEPSKRLG